MLLHRASRWALTTALATISVAAGSVTLWLMWHRSNFTFTRVTSTYLPWHADFLTFYKSAIALLHGQPVYATGASLPNLNPPFMVILFAPFVHFHPGTAFYLLAALTLLVLLISLGIVADQIGLSILVTMLVAFMMLVSTPFLGTIGLGQIYGGLTLGLVMAWYMARRGSPVWSGVFLGLVIAVKPTLAPVLLLPIAQRRWPMLWSAIATGVGATLLAFVVAGPQATIDWLRLSRATPVPDYFENASLPGFVVRQGGPAWLGFAIAAVLLAITFVRMRRDSDLAFWSFVAASLLLSPISWDNYLLLVYPGVLVLLKHRRYTLSAMLLVVPTITTEWITLWPVTHPRIYHLAVSYFFVMLLLYWLALTFTQIGPKELPTELRADRSAEADDRAGQERERLVSVVADLPPDP